MATFLLEVGTEELPASFVESAIEQWRSQIPHSLEEYLLTPHSLKVYGTPRRLAILAEGLPEQQPDQTEEVKGPPAKAAFKDGKPTKAAEGLLANRASILRILNCVIRRKESLSLSKKRPWVNPPLRC